MVKSKYTLILFSMKKKIMKNIQLKGKKKGFCKKSSENSQK